MLRGLFSRRPRIEVEDHVWLDSRQRDAGICGALAGDLPDRGACLLVHDRRSLDELLAATWPRSPLPARDAFEYDAATERLAEPGTLVIALVSDAANRRLRSTPEPKQAPVFHVRGRSTQRREDARLVEALARGRIARVAFHSAFDDPLLRSLARRIGPLLKGLGMREGEPVSGPAVTRALSGAQRG